MDVFTAWRREKYRIQRRASCSFNSQKSRFSNYFQPFLVYLQKAVDDAVDKRIIRRLLRRNGLREVLKETEKEMFKWLFLKGFLKSLLN